MANVTLTAADSQYTVAAGNNVDLNGLSGAQTITIENGASANLIGTFEGDQIIMAGNATDYTVVKSGATVTLVHSQTGAVIALPAKPEPTSLQFDDGTRELKIDSSGDTPQVQLGNDTVTDTPTQPAVDTDGPASSFTIAAQSSSVTEGETVSFTVTASEVSDQDRTFSYQLMGDAIAGASADPAADLGRITGEVTLLAGETTATFTVTPTDDGVTEGFEGFRAALLDSQFNTVASSSGVAIVDGAEAGRTFSLTTDVDNLQGSAGDDIFSGIRVGDSIKGGTVNPGDTINGGDGYDALRISVTGQYSMGEDSVDLVGSLRTESVEELIISNYGQNSDSSGSTYVMQLDATDMQDLEQIVVDAGGSWGVAAGTGNLVSGIQQLTDVTFSNDAPILLLQYAAGVTDGDNDSMKVTLKNQDAAILQVQGVEHLTVEAQLQKGLFAAPPPFFTREEATPSLKSLTLVGDQDLYLGARPLFPTFFAEGVATVDASALGGRLSSYILAGSFGMPGNSDAGYDVALTLTGSQQDDMLLIAGLGTDDHIDGGEGWDSLLLDTLFSDDDDDSVLSVSLDDVDVQNVEQFGVMLYGEETSVELDLNATTFDEFAIVAQGADDEQDVTATNIADGTLISILSANEDDGLADIELSLADATGADDQLSIALEMSSIGDDLSEDVSIDSITVADVEVLNLSSVVDENTAHKQWAFSGEDVELQTAVPSNAEPTGEIDVESLVLDSAHTVNITGNVDLDIGGVTAAKLATINAATFTGDFAIDLDGGDVALISGSGNDRINMQSSLTAADVIDGGSEQPVINVPESDKVLGDLLLATIDGLGTSAQAEVLQLTDIEEIVLELENSASYIDLTADTSLARLSLNGDQNITVSGIAAQAETILYQYQGTVDLSLVDGMAADTLKIGLDGNDDVDAALVVAETVETLVVDMMEGDNHILDLTSAKSETLKVTGGEAGSALRLTNTSETLSDTTTVLDASGLDSLLAAKTSDTATTVTLKGGAIHNVTGGAGDDVFTVSATDTNVTYQLDGGTGTDTLNLGVGSATFNTSAIEGFEVVNLQVDAGANAKVLADPGGAVNSNDITTLTVSGGDSDSTIKIGDHDSNVIGLPDSSVAQNLTAIDMSAFAGDSLLVFGGGAFGSGEDSNPSVLGDQLEITGAAGTDTVVAAYNGSVDKALKVTDVENLFLNFDWGSDGSTSSTLDASSIVGVEVIGLAVGQSPTSGDSVTVSNLAAGVRVGLGWDDVSTGELTHDEANSVQGGDVVVEVQLANHTGTADALTVEVNDLTYPGAPTDATTLNAAGIEALTLDVSVDSAAVLDLSGVAATAGSGLDITLEEGAAGEMFKITGLHDSVATLDAGAFAGGVVLEGRGAGVLSMTTGTGDDQLLMSHKDDVLAAGSGENTLTVQYTAVVGGMAIDLNATDDQIITFNGGANTALQSGFQHVDLSGYSGSGAEVIAHADGSKIKGTAETDNIVLGSGQDTVSFAATGASNGLDTITNFTVGSGKDVLSFEDFIDGGLSADTVRDAASTSNVDADDTVNLYDSGSSTLLTATDIAGLFKTTDATADNVFKLSDSEKTVIISGDADTDETWQVFMVDASLDGTNTDVSEGDVVLVGTVSGDVDLASIDVSNIYAGTVV
ncbi:MAG: hypothetical protein OIF57_06380 [Marinobacterium sp.]|nr:hypothetical protein [Marinobacterium sp.]